MGEELEEIWQYAGDDKCSKDMKNSV